MRVALYARVSTKDKGQDPDLQLEQLRDFAARQRWDIYAEYVDSMTGKRKDRPALERLEADARSRKFDVILVWKLDRLMRNLRHFSNFMAELDLWGVSLVTTAQPIDTRDRVMGKLVMNIMAAIAEWQADNIAENVRTGVQRYIRTNGHWTGGRKRLEFTVPNGLSIREAAKVLGVSRETIRQRRACSTSAV